MTPVLDAVLPAVYRDFDVPADQLVTDPELGERFLDRIRERVGTRVEKPVVFKRLITLRKMGRLPRLRR